MNFSDQWCWITGGSSGIGLAIAQQFRRRNANLVLVARRPELLKSAATKLAMSGAGELRTLALDLTAGQQLKFQLGELLDEIGPPAVLINNAGTVYPAPFEELPAEQLDSMFACNFFAPWQIVQLLLPAMRQRRSGIIVNVASMAALIGIYGYTGYSAAKAALLLFSQALRNEVAAAGLKTVVLCPGDTTTPQLEQENLLKPPETKKISSFSRPLSPETVAAALMKALESRRCPFYVVPGLVNKLSWAAYRCSPALVHAIIDRDVRLVRRKGK